MRTPRPEHFLSESVRLGLAEAFAAGPWTAEGLAERGAAAVGRRARWLAPLAGRLIAAFGDRRPTVAALAAFLATDDGLRRADARRPVALSYGRRPPPVMWPAPGEPDGWTVPVIRTPGELAERLGVGVGELDWFADVQGRPAPEGPRRHYRNAWQPKAAGLPRLIEAPKPRLKSIQRRLLDEVLAPIPPHEAAHGFRAGRSVRTFASPHCGRAVVLRLDLHQFFPSVSAARVTAILLTAGYPEPVARILAGLCTARTPRDAWDLPGAPGAGPEVWRVRRLYAAPHLPQGAPSSPALANLAAYRLDTRLSALAAVAGATYTRYADDLAFSGGPGFARSARRFVAHVGAVALEEGFSVNARKTRVMPRGVCQRVAGVIVNEHPNASRDEFDRLKALLTNCARLGPAGQNRAGHPDFRAHLAGRVAHIALLNPARGAKLRAILDAIEW